MRWPFFLSSIFLFCSACAPLQPPRPPSQTLQQRFDAAKQNCQNLYSNPALDPIRYKVSLFLPENQPLTMRTDTTRVTKNEKAAIATWDQLRQQCYSLVQSAYGNSPPQIKTIIAAYEEATNSLVAQLYLRQISYGNFATKTEENLVATKTAMVNVSSALMNQTIQTLLAQRQTNAMQVMAQQTGRPIQMHCRSFANQFDCN